MRYGNNWIKPKNKEWENGKLAKPDPTTLTMRTSSTVGERKLEKRGKNKSKNGQKLKLKNVKSNQGKKMYGTVTGLQMFCLREVKM